MELRPATREEFDAFSVAALRAFHRVYTDADCGRHADAIRYANGERHPGANSNAN